MIQYFHPIQIWTSVRSSLWFLPTVIVSCSIVLAMVLIQVDSTLALQRFGLWSRWFGTGAEGARGMLSAIATSMITVAGVTFSITIVAIAQVSNQLTPRILRTFMRDRANQFVLGVFTGVFAYCLVVLRTVRGGEEEFIPSFSINAGLLMSLAGVAVLIFFIHHIAMSLQASYIISSVAEETTRVIDKLFPEDIGEEPGPGTALPEGLHWHSIRSKKSGYVQSIESGAAASAAEDAEGILLILLPVGRFAEDGVELARLGSTHSVEPRTLKQALSAFDISRHRTIERDAAFGITQLVDVALKALSPAVSDPTTAVTCVNYLGALLAKLSRRGMPEPQREVNGVVRVIAPVPRFADFVDLAFSEITRRGVDEPRVLLALLQALQAVIDSTNRVDRLRIIEYHLQCVERAISNQPGHDRKRLSTEVALLRHKLSLHLSYNDGSSASERG